MSLVLVVLWACVLARAEQYSDYAAASMPQYSMEEGSHEAVLRSEDYRERSHHFDYKYEEDLKDKVNKVYKPSNSLKDQPNLSDDDELQKNEEESVPKFKMSLKNRRHRSRIKNEEVDTEDNSYRYKPPKLRSRIIEKNDLDTRNEYYAHKSRLREDNTIESVDVKLRKTTEKVIRRKPRDKRINLKRLDVDDEDDDDDEDMDTLESEDIKHLRRDDVNAFARDEYAPNRNANSRQYMIQNPQSRSFHKNNRMKSKNYPDYDDNYYDMKRVNDVKNQLPGLLRNTQASTPRRPRTRPVQDFSFRRANVPEITRTNSKNTESTSRKPIVTKLTNMTKVSASKGITISTELSIAEKSRLSILKKAQKKNIVKNVALTTKPPVLMQVTKHIQTVVMVEPPETEVRRAREVFKDSPGRIAKAKKLMRQKLVVGARSVHDLTDNWDEMVCDYIDVSLLDGGSCSTNPNLGLLFLCLISLNYWFNMFVF